MPQKCQVCHHPKTHEIDKQIVQGIPHTRIAKKYKGLNYQNIWRHAQNHLPEKLVKYTTQKEREHVRGLNEILTDLMERVYKVLDEADKDGHKNTLLKAVGQAKDLLEFRAKVEVKRMQMIKDEQEKETGLAEQQVSEGLKVLSDAELKTLIQLQGKIVSANPDYELDPSSRYVVDAMNSVQTPTGFNESLNDHSFDPDSPDDLRQTRSRQPKNTKKHGSEDDDLLLDDLDDLDLELDDLSNEIPSEQSDPEWLRKERRRRRRRRR